MFENACFISLGLFYRVDVNCLFVIIFIVEAQISFHFETLRKRGTSSLILCYIFICGRLRFLFLVTAFLDLFWWVINYEKELLYIPLF